jgi:hypothetical protein
MGAMGGVAVWFPADVRVSSGIVDTRQWRIQDWGSLGSLGAHHTWVDGTISFGSGSGISPMSNATGATAETLDQRPPPQEIPCSSRSGAAAKHAAFD